MTQKEMSINLNECTGCGLCQIACKDEHVGNDYLPWTKSQPDTGHFWIKVVGQERGQIPKVRVTYIPLACVHCGNAPCMKACPENAIDRREDGIVWIRPEKCTGCRLCQEACPYNAIYFNEQSHIAQKCTFCVHRIDQGLVPRCADVCPRDAIIFGDSDSPELSALRQHIEVLHPEYETDPRVNYVGLPRPFIAGTVVDVESGEVISDADITVTDLFNDKELTVSTDAFGDFWITDLARDHKYMVKVEKQPYERSLLVLKADQDKNVGEIRLTRDSAPSL